MKKKLIPVILILLIATAAFFYFRDRNGRQKVGEIRVSGNIEVRDVGVSFRIPGQVTERLVSEGELVKEGQVVARLDGTNLQQEVNLQTAAVDAAKAALRELEAGSRPEEIEQARANLDRALAESERWKKEYARRQDLFQKGVISANDMDAGQMSFDSANAQVKNAQEALTLARKGPRSEKIDQASAQLQQAEQALSLARTKLAYATLISPLDGLILSHNVEAGEYVSPGTPIITVGKLKSVWLRAYINETDLGRVKVGQAARVETDSYPGKTYNGIISFISSESEFTPKNVQTDKERVKLVYRIKIDIDNAEMQLKPGMPADAILVTGDGR